MLLEKFKALSDETRLRIVTILRSYELTVNELVFVLEMGQSRVSRHLKILVDAGLIKNRRDGLYVYYFYERSDRSSIIEALADEFESEKREDDLARCDQALTERREKTRQFFNEIAGSWKELKQEILGTYNSTNTIEALLGRYACRSVADLGCGNGDLAQDLVSRGYQVIGVDYSPAMVENARLRFEHEPQTQVPDFRIGEIEHLPMRDREVDCAVLNLVLHHLAEPKSAIEEIARTIKDNAYFILVDFERHTKRELCIKYGDRWPGFDKGDIDQWLTEAGFQIVEYDSQRLKNAIHLHIYCAQKIINGGFDGNRTVAKGA